MSIMIDHSDKNFFRRAHFNIHCEYTPSNHEANVNTFLLTNNKP